MTLRKYKPTSPGRRFFAGRTFEEITKKEPEKTLLVPLKKSAGRNVYGRVTARHRGGGHKRKYRLVDFKRDKDLVPARVAGIEYDPNRSANIALLHYADGEKRYILAPLGLQEGDTVISGPRVEIRPGNALPLGAIPVGTFVHNIELKVGAGGQIARSAGSAAQLAAKEGKYAHLRLPSGEVRLVSLDCRATIGQLGNLEHENIRVGKAGRSRWVGRRPKVRGSAMNPVDHPHGGGEGKAPIGLKPVTPGEANSGYKTRRKKKPSDQYIVRSRKG